MKERFKQDLKDLSNLIAVSGSEQEVIRYLVPRLEKCCDKVEVTTMGTVLAYKSGQSGGPRVVLTAHMDEIGCAVKNITPDGFLKFEKVGDYSDKLFGARKVWIQTKSGRIPGVIGMRAAHLMTKEDALKAQTAKQSYIDIGAASREEAADMGVRIGDKIVLQSDFMQMHNPDLVSTRAVDCRLGCALVLNLLENIQKEDFAGEIIGAFSVLEETTIAGAFAIYNSLLPDYAIVLDTVPCGDVPDIDTDAELPVYMGKGPVLILSQGDPTVVRYSCIHPKLQEALYEAARSIGLSLQELAICENAYITEQSLSFMGGKGTPSATVGIPRRYSHTPVETVNLNDALSTYQLLMQLLKQNGQMDLSFI